AGRASILAPLETPKRAAEIQGGGRPTGGRVSPTTLVTPAHAGDLERFRFQRESIERCGIDLPHVALVDDEDVPLFRDLPHARGLTVISTREVLSRGIEDRRRAWGVKRRDPRYWWRTRTG